MKKIAKKSLFTKSLLTASLFALFPVSSWAAETTGGTVNFTGSVVTSACAIGSGSASIDVQMGQVRTSTLAEPGSDSGTAKPFSIVLEGCDTTVSKTAAVTFSGTQDANDPTTLAVGSNGGAGSAQNVAIRLYDEQGTVVKLGEATSAVALRNGDNTLNFSAKYYSAKGAATAGDASAVATYTLTYA